MGKSYRSNKGAAPWLSNFSRVSKSTLDAIRGPEVPRLIRDHISVLLEATEWKS